MKSTVLVAAAAALIALVPGTDALYTSKDAVVSVDSKSFAAEVTKFPGVVAVEFYAP
jgi:uncharacterized membrane protein YjjB (DUF3815 family)